MIVASLFGTPAGLEVRHISIGEVTSLVIEDAWVDMSLDNVDLKGDSAVFRIYRRREAGKLLTWVGVYRSAREVGPNRSGGFYGAGVWLIDSIISSTAIYAVVTNLSDQLSNLALRDGKFVKKIADIWQAITPPPEVATLVAGRTQVTSRGLDPDESMKAFITDHKNVIAVIDWAQKEFSANFYGDVLIGSSDQFISQTSTYIKGFTKFDSIASAADFAYSQRNQALISQSKLLGDLRKEAAGRENKLKLAQSKLQEDARLNIIDIEEKHKIAQSKLKDSIKTDYMGQLTQKNGRIAQLEEDINILKARKSELKSRKLPLEGSLPLANKYKPGSDWSPEEQRESGLEGLYGAEQSAYGSVYEWLIAIAVLFLLGALVMYLWYHPYACWHVVRCESNSQTTSTHVPIPKVLPVYGVSAPQNAAPASVSQPEGACSLDLERFKNASYRIRLNNDKASRPNVYQVKLMIYEKIEETCKLPLSPPSCTNPLAASKKDFLKGNQLVGEILVPSGCSGSIDSDLYSFNFSFNTN